MKNLLLKIRQIRQIQKIGAAKRRVGVSAGVSSAALVSVPVSVPVRVLVSVLVSALAASTSSAQSAAQSAAKPPVASQTTGVQPAAVTTSAPAGPKGKLIPDIWVITGEAKYLREGAPPPKPVLTAESLQQMRAIPCVAELTARREVAFLDLAAKDGKPLNVSLWTFDSAHIGARGWRLNAAAALPNTYYLSTDLAARLGLPAKAATGLRVQPVSSTPTFSIRTVRLDAPPTGEDLTSKPPPANMAPPSAAYGGTFDADTKLLSRQTAGLILQFEPLFRSQSDKWTDEQRRAQVNGNRTTLYARTKPGLNTEAREACRAKLQAHTKIWETELPALSWSFLQLTD